MAEARLLGLLFPEAVDRADFPKGFQQNNWVPADMPDIRSYKGAEVWEGLQALPSFLRGARMEPAGLPMVVA